MHAYSVAERMSTAGTYILQIFLNYLNLVQLAEKHWQKEQLSQLPECLQILG